MIPAAWLAHTFESNLWLIKRLTEGVQHGESLFQPPYQGNCMSWILAHLLYNREYALGLMGGQALIDSGRLARFKTGSPPLTDGEEALPFSDLLSALDRSQVLLEGRLAASSEESLERVVDTPRGERPLGVELDGLAWHETYHTGQLELVRQMIVEARRQGWNPASAS